MQHSWILLCIIYLSISPNFYIPIKLVPDIQMGRCRTELSEDIMQPCHLANHPLSTGVKTPRNIQAELQQPLAGKINHRN